MTAKEELEKISVLQEKVDEQKMYVSQLVSAVDGMSAIRYDKEHVQSSPPENPMLEKLIKIDEQKEKLQSMIDELIMQKIYCIDMIHEIKDNLLQKILYLVYIDDKSLQDVAEELEYTYQYTRELHSKALKNLHKTYTLSTT